MHPVTSSNLSYVGWQDGTLYITFHSGKKYKYNNVPENVFNDLKNSSSVGKTFNTIIRGNYTSEEI